MATKPSKSAIKTTNTAATPAPPKPDFIPDPKIPAWLYDFKIQAIIVAVLAIVLYANTFTHESAHDDTMVIVQNEYVLEGLAGIPSIMTKDAYDSYYRQFNSGNQLSGGRYRPLSIVTFALEQQLFGTVPKEKMDSFLNHPMAMGVKDPWERKFIRDMHTRHVLSVLWYALAVVVLLYFLRQIVLRDHPLVAFIAVLIFTAHPIHTEVVANVKSRDEIMSLLFMSLTFIYAFKYEAEKKNWMLGLGVFFYLLAFLSKEYAITMIALLPLSFILFNKYSLGKSIKASLPYLALMAAYIITRSSIVSSEPNPDSAHEILNNPYAFVSNDMERYATEISTTFNYLKLLVWPHPLSADYSYKTIPYVDFSNLQVWISLAAHIGLVWAMFGTFKICLSSQQKSLSRDTAKAGLVSEAGAAILCFSIAFYLLHLALICNLFFDIGATMGERLIFHSSVGFCVGAAYLLVTGAEKIKQATIGRVVLAGSTAIILIVFGYFTIERNPDWKNDFTLFTHDVKVVPNSTLVNANVAAAYIDKSEFEKTDEAKKADIMYGIELLNKSIELHPTYVTAYLNKGLAYFKLRMPDSVVKNLDIVRKMYPNHPKLPEMYFNAGVNFYLNKNYHNAVTAWNITLQLKPEYEQARNALNVLKSQGLMP